MTPAELRDIYANMRPELRKRVSAETIAVIHNKHIDAKPSRPLVTEKIVRNAKGEAELHTIARNPWAPYASKWEYRYAERLAVLKLLGEITDYAYEPDTLVAAGGTKYTPDFLVTMPDGSKVYHEVKGYFRSRDKVRVRECAAASPYPIRVMSLKGGTWTEITAYLTTPRTAA